MRLQQGSHKGGTFVRTLLQSYKPCRLGGLDSGSFFQAKLFDELLP
jgi:hypothetical protein